MPSVCPGAGKTDGVKTVQCIKQAHCGGGCKIDILQRLIQRDNVLCNPFGPLAAFRNNQKTASVPKGNQLIATGVVIHRKLGGKLQLHAAFRLPAVSQSFLCFGSSAPTEKRQEHKYSQNDRDAPFHAYSPLMVALSKCSV